MKKLRLALLAATAATLVSAGAASAQSASNKVFLEQNGSGNAAGIDQTNVAGDSTGNEFGTSGLVATQSGDGNVIDTTQSGDTNKIGNGDNGFDQIGDNNKFKSDQTSDGNVVGEVQQTADPVATAANDLTITQQNVGGSAFGAGNEIVSVKQTTNDAGANKATVVQNGSGNEILAITQTNSGADDNSIDVTLKGTNNGSNGYAGGSYAEASGVAFSTLTQDGSNNKIILNVDGTDNEFGVKQLGSLNTLETLNVTGDQNQLGALQDGTSGAINDLEILGIYGDSNDIGVIQNGGGSNTAFIDLGGASGAESTSNQVLLRQADGADANIDIAVGGVNDINVNQYLASGGNNNVDVDVNGSANDIDIIQDGNNTGFNAAVVNLTGNGNIADVTQQDSSSATVMVNTGDSNIVSLNQADNSDATVTINNGSLNSLTGTQSGYNDLDVTLNGSSNDFTVTQSLGTTGAGNLNTLAVTVFGDSNGNGTFTAAGDAADIGLTAGVLNQEGVGNNAVWNVGLSGALSNSNVLAMSQVGDGNNATVNITGGNGNEVAIAQNGDSNNSVVTQIGSNNIVGVNQ